MANYTRSKSISVIDCNPSGGTHGNTSSSRRRASLDFLLKMSKSTSTFEALFRKGDGIGRRSPSPAPRRSALGLLKKAVSSSSLRSQHAQHDNASSATVTATDTATTSTSVSIDKLDVSLYKARPRRTSSICSGQTRDSFELMVSGNPDVLDGGQYRPREMTIEELAKAIEGARLNEEK